MASKLELPNAYPVGFHTILRNKGTGLEPEYFEDYSWSRTSVYMRWLNFITVMRTSKLALGELQHIAVWHEWKWKESFDARGDFFRVEAWPKTSERVERWREKWRVKRQQELEGILKKRRAKRKKLAKTT